MIDGIYTIKNIITLVPDQLPEEILKIPLKDRSHITVELMIRIYTTGYQNINK